MRRDVAGACRPTIWRSQNVLGFVINRDLDLHSSRLIAVICQATSDAEVTMAFWPRFEFIDRNLGDCAGCSAIPLQASGLTRIMVSEATGDPEAKYDSADDDNYLSSHSIPSFSFAGQTTI
jgi:hypothetical protein